MNDFPKIKNKIKDHNYSIILENKISNRYTCLEKEAGYILNRDETIVDYEDRVIEKISQQKQTGQQQPFLEKITELKNTWLIDPAHRRLERIAAELVTAALVISGLFTYLVNSNLNYSLPTYLYLLKKIW